MKPTLCSIITLLTLMTLAFVSNGFAQRTSPEYVVRQIYFHPSDRQPSRDMDARLDALVEDVQQFYADEMEHHGFGRKTFRLETDAFGKTVRHAVKGRFPAIDYRRNLREITNFTDRVTDLTDAIGKVYSEIQEHFDLSERFLYLIFIDGDDDLLASSSVGGTGDGGLFGGTANIMLVGFDKAPKSLDYRIFTVIAHELGHAFGLSHDFRDDHYMMSYSYEELKNQLSYCAAEWLDAHRYFNTIQNTFDRVPTITMLPPSFVSPPNTVRFRFSIVHSASLHQAQLLTNNLLSLDPAVDPILLDCRSLNRNYEIIEFVTSELTTGSAYVDLHVMDVHGNFISQRFPIDITTVLPDTKPVLIPDPNLATAIRGHLGLAHGHPITQLDMLGLRRLEAYAKQITDLTGLQHAINLESIGLNDNQVVDLTPLAQLTALKTLSIVRNKVSDVRPLTGLTQLRLLEISANHINDVRPLAGLVQLSRLIMSSNQVSDILPLKGLKNLRTLYLNHNQITDAALTLLAEFPELLTLELSANQIHDIAPLAKLTGLNALTLTANPISDLTPLAGLTQLNRLSLGGCHISDITPLKELKDLQLLGLPSNQISDITPLEGLKNLRVLSLDNNQISDVSSLTGLVNLEHLSLAGNSIKNRKPLLALLRGNPNVKIYLKRGGEPLPVTLSHFRAEHTSAGIVLKWTTESELDNAGFYIYRSETKNGEFKIVNPTMIQGAGTTSERHTYTWTDTSAKPNTVYYYRIEDISHAGVRKQLATVRMRGIVSASGKLTTRWADLKANN